MSKKTLVIGASENVQRYSNMAIRKLKQFEHEVKAFGLRKGEVDGVVIDTDLLSYENIDMVTLYLSPKNQEAYYDYILGLKPKRVIFNPGTENPEFYETLKNNGIDFEEACTLVLLNTKQY
ncbi:CoA-binding protein [Flavobacterium sp. I3-2]|uniref:CoA-binding protein n=1 Tax=Flavobacterium sp. I3-2 TaxID=2748319 RepID=UPI0015B1E7EE|nr:CoA-binding protein [Flavobacterium sp. I3-2]